MVMRSLGAGLFPLAAQTEGPSMKGAARPAEVFIKERREKTFFFMIIRNPPHEEIAVHGGFRQSAPLTVSRQYNALPAKMRE
jgi:hypothetical protein